jgi:hypothetical protein
MYKNDWAVVIIGIVMTTITITAVIYGIYDNNLNLFLVWLLGIFVGCCVNMKDGGYRAFH